MVLIDGRELAKEIRENLAEKVKTFKTKPKLAVILCGDDEASNGGCAYFHGMWC